ncbi:hypothetical protein [Paenimyroides ceti]|nr:hypothetical protein [Paenimyroides ceti]
MAPFITLLTRSSCTDIPGPFNTKIIEMLLIHLSFLFNNTLSDCVN